MDATAEILDELPRFMLMEAIQAAERGDESCPVCGELVASPERAALLAYPADYWFTLALTHRRCQQSQVLEDGNPLIKAMSPDTFSLAWRHVLRDRAPGAVLLWENKTSFDAIPSFDDVGSMDGGPGWTGYSLRQEGFIFVDDDLDQLDAPCPEGFVIVGRGDGVELREGAVHSQSFPGAPPNAWQTTASREGEVLLVYGTALQLDQFDHGHFRRRVERRKVVAGVVRYSRGNGTVLHSLETEPIERGTEDELPNG